MRDAKQQLSGAAQAIGTAILLLKSEQPIMEEFLQECRDMDNFGYVVSPTLANDPERRAVSALMEPLFQAAVDFVRLYDAHTAKTKRALAKVA